MAEALYLGLNLVRIFANILIFKKPAICKITFYLEILITCTASLMPMDVPLEHQAMKQLDSVYLTFMMSYFNYKSDIFLSTLSLVPFYVARGVFYDNRPEILVPLAIITIIWHSLTLFVTHLVTVKIGMLVAENTVL